VDLFFIICRVPQDAKSLEEIKLIRQDLKDIRHTKLQSTLQTVLKDSHEALLQNPETNLSVFFNHLDIPNMGCFEMSQFRHILSFLSSKYKRFDSSNPTQ
jgi:hypothetical protein